MLHLKYDKRANNLGLETVVLNYLKQFPKRGGVFCISNINTSICTNIAFHTNYNVVSRQPSLWWVHGLLKSPITPRVVDDKKYLINIIAEDFSKNHPQWVIITPRDFIGIPVFFNLSDLLSTNKIFRQEWSHYELKTTFPKEGPHTHLANYYIYERKDFE
jgi:hypothetical protein